MTDKRFQPHTLPVAEIFATKPFLKIGEVAKVLGIKPHVLRYWESEFPSLKPKKNPSGQRIYAKADIEAIVEIQNLLYNQRYTISGAKNMLARQEEGEQPTAHHLTEDVLSREVKGLKRQVEELLALLQQMPEF